MQILLDNLTLTDFPSKLGMPHQTEVAIKVKEKSNENDNPYQEQYETKVDERHFRCQVFSAGREKQTNPKCMKKGGKFKK